MSKCRQMNKLYCGMRKIMEYRKKKVEITETRKIKTMTFLSTFLSFFFFSYFLSFPFTFIYILNGNFFSFLIENVSTL